MPSREWNTEWNVLGAVHKVRHARGGIREGVTVCDRGEGGIRSMWRHANTFFYHTYETWNLKWCLPFCCKRCVLREGGMDKNHPEENLSDKTPGQKPPRTIESEFVQGAFVRVFCTRPTKNRGVRDMWRTFGGSRDVWQSVTEGEAGQNWPKIAWRTLWTAPHTFWTAPEGVRITSYESVVYWSGEYYCFYQLRFHAD